MLVQSNGPVVSYTEKMVKEVSHPEDASFFLSLDECVGFWWRSEVILGRHIKLMKMKGLD